MQSCAAGKRASALQGNTGSRRKNLFFLLCGTLRLCVESGEDSPDAPVLLQTIALCGFAFLAGLVDSVVGGGGLIQLPALLILLPAATPAADVLGTNKCASIAGTAAAVWNYARFVRAPASAVWPTAAAGLVFAGLGSWAVSQMHPGAWRPLVLGLLVAVAAYTFSRKDFGALHAPRLSPGAQTWAGGSMGAAIGFYDGFFGPGTGSFLIFGFIGVFGFDFLTASAASKAVNLATNLSSVVFFASTGHVMYSLAIPMAACNILGSMTGTRLAVARGSQFVRRLFLVVVSAIICKLAWDLR